MYGTLAEWRAWSTERGDSAPTTADDAVALAALVRASDYIRAVYLSRISHCFDIAASPVGYEYPLVSVATFIAAGMELATPGFWTKTYTPAEAKVLTAVGSIEWTVTGDSSSSFSSTPTSTMIEAMFGPYLNCRRFPAILVV